MFGAPPICIMFLDRGRSSWCFAVRNLRESADVEVADVENVDPTPWLTDTMKDPQLQLQRFFVFLMV